MLDTKRGSKMNTEIPNTAFQQFGGYRAMSMIGGSPLIIDQFTLRITWKAKAVNSARMLTIRLEPSDTYTVTFFTLHGKVIQTFENIYADQLRDIFEYHTQLFLSF
jgi:hypothetical protein